MLRTQTGDDVTIITNAIKRFANAMRFMVKPSSDIEGWQQSTVKRLSTTTSTIEQNLESFHTLYDVIADV